MAEEQGRMACDWGRDGETESRSMDRIKGESFEK